MFQALVLSIIAFLTLEDCDPEAKLKPYRCLGHVNAARSPEGKKVVLTGTEWPG